MLDTESYTIDAIKIIGAYLEEKEVIPANPTDSVTADYGNDVFVITSHNIAMELDAEYPPPNFIYKPFGLEVEWYNHVGRGTFSNRPVSIDDAVAMLEACIASINATSAIVPEVEDIWQEEEE